MRGVAVLGILTMNAVSHGLDTVPYFNLDAGGSRTWLDWALAGAAPNTLATIPLSLAYLSLIALWNNRAESRLRGRVRATGRMALTNYLAQTVLGIIMLRVVFDDIDLSRSQIALFILGVWAVQLWWSQAWLARFRFGPAEWLWRCATYRRWQPLRASTD